MHFACNLRVLRVLNNEGLAWLGCATSGMLNAVRQCSWLEGGCRFIRRLLKQSTSTTFPEQIWLLLEHCWMLIDVLAGPQLTIANNIGSWQVVHPQQAQQQYGILLRKIKDGRCSCCVTSKMCRYANSATLPAGTSYITSSLAQSATDSYTVHIHACERADMCLRTRVKGQGRVYKLWRQICECMNCTRCSSITMQKCRLFDNSFQPWTSACSSKLDGKQSCTGSSQTQQCTMLGAATSSQRTNDNCDPEPGPGKTPWLLDDIAPPLIRYRSCMLLPNIHSMRQQNASTLPVLA
jgi:hypothetical protein